MLRIRLAVLLSLFVQASMSIAEDATTPGELRMDSTPKPVNIEWDLVDTTATRTLTMWTSVRLAGGVSGT